LCIDSSTFPSRSAVHGRCTSDPPSCLQVRAASASKDAGTAVMLTLSDCCKDYQTLINCVQIPSQPKVVQSHVRPPPNNAIGSQPSSQAPPPTNQENAQIVAYTQIHQMPASLDPHCSDHATFANMRIEKRILNIFKINRFAISLVRTALFYD